MAARGSGAPGSTTSSPVEKIATRSRRRTSSSGEPERGGERDVLRLEHGAGRQHHRACRHVLAGEPPVGAALEARRHDHRIAFDRHVLLHEHGVGAGRHRRAGEDADGLAGLDRQRRVGAGGQPAGDDEPRVGIRHRDRRGAPRSRRRRNCRTAAGRPARSTSPPSTRPRAPVSGTRSVSATGVMRSPISRSMSSSRKQRTGKREAVVGELRHQRAPRRRRLGSSGTAALSSTVGDRLDVVEIDHRHLRLRQRRVGGDGDDMRVVRLDQRLAVRGAMDFDLGEGIALVALDHHEVDRRHLGDQRAAGPTPARRAARAGSPSAAPRRRSPRWRRRAVHEGVLARLVEVEAVMGVLERRHAQAARDQARDRAW